MNQKKSPGKVVREIRRKTRHKFTAVNDIQKWTLLGSNQRPLDYEKKIWFISIIIYFCI
jgi:hypothetical protein